MAMCVPALAETEVELRTRVISALRVVEVQSAPAVGAQYLGDGDPQTIEVLRFRVKGDGPSRVSADGQVVYLALGEGTSKHWEKYLNRAFEIHFRKARVSEPNSSLERSRDR
jgi:hypothetical protein